MSYAWFLYILYLSPTTISSAFDLRISLFETADKLSYPTTVKTIRNTTLIPLLVHTVDICESITLRKCLFVCLENRYSTVSVLSLADGPNPKMAPFCKSQPAANFGSAMHKFFSISFWYWMIFSSKTWMRHGSGFELIFHLKQILLLVFCQIQGDWNSC